jgi:transposase
MSRIGPIGLPEADRERLEKLVRDRNTPQKVVWRSRIVLLSAGGMRPPAIAAAVGKSELTVRRWRRRYLEKGVPGLLKDATRPPGRKPLSVEVIKRVVDLTLHEVPPGRTRWSQRTMAAKVGIAPSSVHTIWKAHGLKPHLTRTFKLSRDPAFTEKVEDIVGLYINPPDKALVLSVPWRSTRNRRSRHSTAPSRACRSRRAAPAP